MLMGLVLQSNRAASLLVWLMHIQINLCSVYPLCVLSGSERGPTGPADLCVGHAQGVEEKNRCDS